MRIQANTRQVKFQETACGPVTQPGAHLAVVHVVVTDSKQTEHGNSIRIRKTCQRYLIVLTRPLMGQHSLKLTKWL
jgi:hypothetical protein